jgi:hypothetical protein
MSYILCNVEGKPLLEGPQIHTCSTCHVSTVVEDTTRLIMCI